MTKLKFTIIKNAQHLKMAIIWLSVCFPDKIYNFSYLLNTRWHCSNLRLRLSEHTPSLTEYQQRFWRYNYNCIWFVCYLRTDGSVRWLLITFCQNGLKMILILVKIRSLGGLWKAIFKIIIVILTVRNVKLSCITSMVIHVSSPFH